MIDIEGIKKLEKLAGLILEDEERNSLAPQIGQILDFTKCLDKYDLLEIDRDHEQHTTLLRKDDGTSKPEMAKVVLENAPDRQENQFKLLRVVEGVQS